MCSGSTASRPPPQATPTPGRQATWATTGNCQPRARQATGARRPANGLAASHTSTRPAPDSELSGDTHRPRPRHTPPTPTTRPPQPGRHRLGQQGHQAETTGHQPTFREHAETQATVQPGDRPLLARDLGVYPAPPRAARGGGHPLLSPSPLLCRRRPARGRAPPRHSPSGFMHLVTLDLTRSRQATSRGAPHQPQPHDPTGLRRPPGPE